MVMSFRPDHEIHRRRLGRNVGLGLTLVAFAAIIFGLTVVKVAESGPIQGYDHVVRPGLVQKAVTE
jgi:hypothetical protein